MKVDQVNAVIGKDLAKEKAAAEVAMKIINRLEAALVDTEKHQILDAKKAAIQERIAQVNAEIEKVLAAEKAAASVTAMAEKATDELSAKKKAAEDRDCFINAQVDAEIERILATEKTAAFAAVVTEKSATKVTQKQKTTEEIEQIDNLVDIVLAPVETPLILDSENIGMSERVAQNKPSELNSEELLLLIDDIKLKPYEVTTTEIAATHNIPHIRSSEELLLLLDDIMSNPIEVTTFDIDAPQKIAHKQNELETSTTKPSCSRIIYSEAALHFDTFDNEVAEAMIQYDFVLTNKLGLLETGDQWIEEAAQKRRLRQGSAKSFAWLHPFLPLEVEIKQLLEVGPKLASEVAKQLRAQIRERKKDEQTYYDLHNALFSTPQLVQIQMWEPQYATPVIAKQLRVLIRECRRNKQPCDNLLRALYGSHVASYFVRSLTFEGPIDKIAHHVDIRELRNIRIDFLTMGYHYIESLLITDIKWLIEAFGEPISHQTFDAIWPNIRRNAISRYCWEELRISNETARSNWRSEKSMIEWLSGRVRDWWVRRNVWLEQKVDRKAQLAARPVIVKSAPNVKQRGVCHPPTINAFSLFFSI